MTGIRATLEPLVSALELPIGEESFYHFDRLYHAMISDPLYPSVSKIFDQYEIVTKHFIDSLAPLSEGFECFPGKGGKVLDMGCGAGFPVLPLAIALPEVTFCALDAKEKAVEFVARMATAVGLKNLEARHSRAEEAGRDAGKRERYDLVLCRAVAEVRILIELCLPLVRVGGFALFYKGPKIEEELTAAANALKELGISPNDVTTRTIAPPLLPFERSYVMIRKQKPSPEKYPRRNGIPAAKAL